MSDLLTSDRTHTGQVSDSESSINESDCEALISSPCSKSASSSSVKIPDKKLDSDSIASHSDSVSQQVINMQILSQLQSLGRRLDDMEAKNCKKTIDRTKIENETVKKKVKSADTPVLKQKKLCLNSRSQHTEARCFVTT